MQGDAFFNFSLVVEYEEVKIENSDLQIAVY